MTERKIALVTGASEGIGRAIALELSPHYHLILVARTESKLREVAGQCESAEVYTCDLRDPADIERLATAVGDVDVLINNAGVEAMQTIESATWQNWEGAFQLNVFAPAYLTAKLLPSLRCRSGQVVMVNSGAGRFSGAGMGVYAGTKHALDALTKALREEERGRVRVIAVHPGRVDTPMQRRMYAEDGRPYRSKQHLAPTSISRAVLFALQAPGDGCVEEISVRPDPIK